MAKYIDVPPCPRCHSEKTGYYLECGMLPSNKIIANYLKKGEIVRPMIDRKMTTYTSCFCEDCNAQWECLITPKRITSDELEKQKEKRGITNGKISNVIKFKRKKKFENLKRRFFH